MPGSPSTVRRYVASRKAGRGEVFLPLCFAPGEEAQVDWGEATVHRERGGAEGAVVLHEALPQPRGVRAGL